jgi:tetratricopeptide (TPR) repeat protein
VSKRESKSLKHAIGVGIISGLVIAVVAAFLIPIRDPEEIDRLENSGISADVSSNAQESPRSILPAQTRTEPLRLPDQPVEVPAESLQKEMGELSAEVLAKYRTDPAAFHIAAQIAFELNQVDQATEYWTKCLSFHPKFVGPYASFAGALINKGKNFEAIEILLQAERDGANSPELFQKHGDLPRPFSNFRRLSILILRTASLGTDLVVFRIRRESPNWPKKASRKPSKCWVNASRFSSHSLHL